MKNVLDAHTHTIASGHAYNTICEMAHEAAEKGLELLGITDHAEQMPGSCKNIYSSNLKILPKRMEGVRMLYGVEANIMNADGDLDVPDRLLAKLDIVIVSLHPPCIAPGSMEENTKAVIGAMQNPYVSILGHPDDGRYPLDYDQVVRCAKENHVLLELNNHSLDPSGARENARENDVEMLRLCMKYGASIILDSDAHWKDDIRNCCFSLPLLEELSFPEELIVNRSLEAFNAKLKKPFM